ncbi:MAG: hypothetical protein OXG23_05190 [Chloroflexi bacterium]|nr:hypothetical protein [Chloroflexota bacterium]
MRWIPDFGVSLGDLPAQRLLGAATLSASALLLEIALTRLFSLIFFPYYVFLIISVAILGIGIGAAVATLWPSFAQRIGFALGSIFAALFTALLLLFAASGSAVDMQLLLFFLLALPYLCFGLVISMLFSAHIAASRILYMGDLLGAGCGALLAIPLLNGFGAINTILIAALGFTVAGLYFSTRRDRLVAVVCAATAGIAFGVNVASRALDMDPSKLAAEKPIVAALSDGGRVLRTSWDAFARTDLVDPGAGRPLRIYVDGGAASVMPTEAARRELLGDIGFFPFATEQPERVFVIGPGAGLDVWFALQSGAQHIIAVEVNGASLELAREWRGYSGPLYDRAEVKVIVDDGRSALRRSGQKFDLIYLSQVVTLAAERGGYALSENTIYTEEAFSDYLNHLDERGQIALKLYDEVTLTRAVSTALSAFRRRGLTDQRALDHLMAFIDGKSSPSAPLLLIGASPFSEDDSLALGAIAREVGFRPLLLPHVLIQPPLDSVASGAKLFDAIIQSSDVDISPATDERPYFFQFEKGIPASLFPLVALAVAVTAVLVLVIGFQLQRGRGSIQRGYPLVFALLGIGFIALEIYVIQRTRLFLGHPTIAVTLVLVTFLVGGGFGSGLSQLVLTRGHERRPQMLTAAVLMLAIVWSVIWSPLNTMFLAADAAVRGLITVLSLAPLAMCMGVPYPLALKLAGIDDRRQVALAWCVNGLMTVVGSVAAVALSLTAGFSAVLYFGAGAYLVATLILAVIHNRGES